MRLVDVVWTGELRFLSDDLGKDDVLLEQKHVQLLRFLGVVRILITTRGTLDTVQRAVQQQFALCRYFTLQKKPAERKWYNSVAYRVFPEVLIGLWNTSLTLSYGK